MSPVSRGRKPKNTKKKPAVWDAGLRAVLDEVLAAFEEVVGSDDPLDVELLTAELLGNLPADPAEVAFPLVSYAASRQNAAGFGLLRAVAAVSADKELRERAETAADKLAALGMREPPWGGALREVTVTECWQQTDVFGDDLFLLLVCDRDGRRHGLVAETDRFDGVIDVYLTTEHDEVLAELHEHDDELLRTGPVSLPEARCLLEDAIAINDESPEEDDPLLDARAYVEARLRVMPPAAPSPEPAPLGEGALDDFLAAEPNADAEFARAFAEFGEDVDEARPLRVSPAKFELFFDQLFGQYELDDEAIEALRATSLALARWQGPRDGLPAAALTRLRHDIEDILAEFTEDEAPAASRG